MSQGYFIGDILSACDRCHSRKVKCDRQQRCANCADAGVECQRVRPGRSRKRPLPGMLTPEESILQLERPILTPPSQRGGGQESEVEDRTPARQRRRIDSHDRLEKSPEGHVRSAGIDCSNHHAMRARSVIQLELVDSRHTSQKQQVVLKAALQLVNQIGGCEEKQPDENVGIETTVITAEDPAIIPDAPPAELLLMLLHPNAGPKWPDHISNKALEKMAAALMKGDFQGQLFHQYCVCIYVKAIMHFYQLSRQINSSVVKEQLVQSRNAYITATLRSIQQFNILASPTLQSIQALVSSALLMQQLGDVKQCWTLNSYAAQQIVALGYDRIRNIPARSQAEEEIHSAVYWCYYLDRTVSALLVRPTALPNLNVSPTELIASMQQSPYDPLIRVLLDLAQIQGHLLAFSSDLKRADSRYILDTCNMIEERMHRISQDLRTSRESLPEMLKYDWVAADFCYYAIYVEILRTRLRCTSTPLVHRECLVYARRSLEAFRFLQQHRAELGFDDPYPSFLTWTLLLYPLSPFFVVFCNIIGTLDKDDHELIYQITTGLSQFKRDSHLEKVLSLLISLERLCESLFHEDGEALPEMQRAAEALPSVQSLTNAGDMDLGQNVSGSDTETSADWLMWQLFNSEVPLGWLNPDSPIL